MDIIPRLEMVKVPPLNSSGVSLLFFAFPASSRTYRERGGGGEREEGRGRQRERERESKREREREKERETKRPHII